MKILFYNIRLPETDYTKEHYCVVTGKFITELGEGEPPRAEYDRVINGRGRLLLPAFCNTHTHAAMTLFRGYGEDLPLDKWLNERIFPAEDHLTDESVYYGSMLAIAEMIRNGVVSFSDMYFFCENTVRAALETGVKANISRCVVTFDPNADFEKDDRMREALALYHQYNGAGDGRVLIDLALHAEYTNISGGVRYLSEAAKELGARMHIHLSETEKEHKECIARHGMTPTEFFLENGAFDVPVIAAHCVYLTDSDRKILAEHGATAVHNPISNLKLGSGIMPLRKTLDAGVNVALGTDGVASNNRLDMIRELQVASLLQKGISRMPDSVTAKEVFLCATKNGFLAQGREDSGEIAVGKRADLILLDLDSIHNIPMYDAYTVLTGSAAASDVSLTMSDGVILYEDGEYTTLDAEKLRAEFAHVHEHYFD